MKRSGRLAVAMVSLALGSTGAAAQSPDKGPEAAGGTCVAIMSATATGVDGDGAAAGDAVRDLFVSFLTGPSIRPVPLEARLRTQALEEAKQKNCAFVVTPSLFKKRGGRSSFGKVIGQAAGTASWYVPGAYGGASVARGAGLGAARAVGDIAQTTREKDELRLDWTLVGPSGSKPTPHSEKLKASSSGEDLLTPLVGHAAEVIAEALPK